MACKKWIFVFKRNSLKPKVNNVIEQRAFPGTPISHRRINIFLLCAPTGCCTCGFFHSYSYVHALGL